MSVQSQTRSANNTHLTHNITDMCLNVGCGNTCPESWENIDASIGLRISKIPLLGSFLLSVIGKHHWSNSVKYGDIVKGLGEKENKYQLVFACHVLEHLALADFHQAIANIYAYLKPGGILRVIVPDLEQYVRTYLTHLTDSTLADKAAHEFMQTSWLGKSTSRSSFFSRLREGFSNSRHQWMWDEPSLKAALLQHGFENIRRCHYGDWSDMRFADVENAGNFVQAIGIEAIKPAKN
ncbi:MAG: methyltransferase domain-containing protein [Nostoc sp. C3-bin3]|nr:methyltransferase domain-containing protein [Nostoc sp. C3-bin3]